MPDVIDVIKRLQEAVDWLSTETSLTVVDQWVVRDALALLQAQEPVEPIERECFFYCGKCRYAFTVHRQKYCSECGQAVKWDG